MTKLWSHSVAQGVCTASADELEALSGRYGPRALVLLPLRSGAWAIFGPDRQLKAIVPELGPEEALLLRGLSENEDREATQRRQVEAQPKVASRQGSTTRLGGKLEDLDL